MPRRSDGMKKNPPNKNFKILQPHKMQTIDLKNPMASRAVGACILETLGTTAAVPELTK